MASWRKAALNMDWRTRSGSRSCLKVSVPKNRQRSPQSTSRSGLSRATAAGLARVRRSGQRAPGLRVAFAPPHAALKAQAPAVASGQAGDAQEHDAAQPQAGGQRGLIRATGRNPPYGASAKTGRIRQDDTRSNDNAPRSGVAWTRWPMISKGASINGKERSRPERDPRPRLETNGQNPTGKCHAGLNKEAGRT